MRLNTSGKSFVGTDQTDFTEKVKRVPISVGIELGVKHYGLPSTGFQEKGTTNLISNVETYFRFPFSVVYT